MTIINPTYETIFPLYDNRFYNQTEHLRDLMISIAENHSLELEYLCVGMGFVTDEKETNPEVLFYYDSPQMFKKYYEYGFEYPRTSSTKKENVMKIHSYWINFTHLDKIVNDNKE